MESVRSMIDRAPGTFTAQEPNNTLGGILCICCTLSFWGWGLS